MGICQVGFERRLLASVRGTLATAVAFPQKSKSLLHYIITVHPDGFFILHVYWYGGICEITLRVMKYAAAYEGSFHIVQKSFVENDLQEQFGIELVDRIHYIVAIAATNDICLSDA